MREQILSCLGLCCVAFLACSSGSSPDPAPAPAPTPTPSSGDGGGASSSSDASTPAPTPQWRSAVGAGGAFAQTFDDAQWDERTLTDKDLFAVSCVDGHRGWAAGAGGATFSTEDSGHTWRARDVPISTDLHAIKVVPSGFGAVAGLGGSLAVTRDGGESWALRDVGAENTWAALTIAETTGVAWVAGAHGALIRSDDLGDHWSTQTIGAQADLRGVATDGSARAVYVVASDGTIWGSHAGSGFALESSGYPALNAVSVSSDASIAVAVGEGGTVVIRGASGTWTRTSTGQDATLHAALVTGGSEGQWLLSGGETLRVYVAGAFGALFTMQGVAGSWQRVPLATHQTLYGLEDL